MIADSSMASGRPSGIMLAVAQAMSSIMTLTSRPFPTRSSIYLHTKFIISTNCTMKNVMSNGPR